MASTARRAAFGTRVSSAAASSHPGTLSTCALRSPARLLFQVRLTSPGSSAASGRCAAMRRPRRRNGSDRPGEAARSRGGRRQRCVGAGGIAVLRGSAEGRVSLDAEWARRSRAALDADRAGLAALRNARGTLERYRKEVRDLIGRLPALPAVDEPELMTLAAATGARAGWLAAPADDLALADHVVATLPALTGAFAALREGHTIGRGARRSLGPIGATAGEWVTQQKLADEKASKVAEVSQALDWLKRNSADLRNQRMPHSRGGPGTSGRPFGKRATSVWTRSDWRVRRPAPTFAPIPATW